MGKESFVMYKKFYKPVSGLSDEQLGRLFRVIFKYQIDGDVTVEKDIEIAFEFFKNQFDIDDIKYQAIVERNRNNGRKGGAPRKGLNGKPPGATSTQGNPNNPVGFVGSLGSFGFSLFGRPPLEPLLLFLSTIDIYFSVSLSISIFIKLKAIFAIGFNPRRFPVVAYSIMLS